MDPKILLDMLGVTSVEDAVKALQNHNTAITNMKAAAGATSLEQLQARINTLSSVTGQVEALTGKQSGEAVAIVTAWKTAAAETEKVKVELEALKKAQADAESKALLDKAVEDGQLEPGKRADFETLNTKFGVEALKTALGALPAASPKTPGGTNPGGGPRQPAASSAQTGPATDEERAIMKATGKGLEEIRAAEKEWADAEKAESGGVFVRRDPPKPASAAA